MPHSSPFAFMNGQVIDMLYFPLFSFNWPDWMPYVGGSSFHFFNAIFNVADSSIFIGVMTLLIWQKRFFPEHNTGKEELNALPKDQEEADLHLQNAIEGTEEDCCVPE